GTATLTINNVGTSTLSVAGITYPNGFSGNWAGTIGAGFSANVTVTFTPTAATSYGGTATVTSGASGGVNTIAVSGIGVGSTGSVQVNLSPSGAVNVGAQWQVDNNGAWLNSGAIASGLAAGNHTISFKSLSGWATPANQIANILANQTVSASGVYIPPAS